MQKQHKIMKSAIVISTLMIGLLMCLIGSSEIDSARSIQYDLRQVVGTDTIGWLDYYNVLFKSEKVLENSYLRSGAKATAENASSLIASRGLNGWYVFDHEGRKAFAWGGDLALTSLEFWENESLRTASAEEVRGYFERQYLTMADQSSVIKPIFILLMKLIGGILFGISPILIAYAQPVIYWLLLMAVATSVASHLLFISQAYGQEKSEPTHIFKPVVSWKNGTRDVSYLFFRIHDNQGYFASVSPSDLMFGGGKKWNFRDSPKGMILNAATLTVSEEKLKTVSIWNIANLTVGKVQGISKSFVGLPVSSGFTTLFSNNQLTFHQGKTELGFRRTDAFSEGDSWAHKWDMGPVVAYFFKKNLHGLLHISRFGNRERSLGLEISLVF